MRLLRRLATSAVLIASGIPVTIIADWLGASVQDRLVLFGAIASVLLLFPLLDVVLAGGERFGGADRSTPAATPRGGAAREVYRFRGGRTGRRRFASVGYLLVYAEVAGLLLLRVTSRQDPWTALVLWPLAPFTGFALAMLTMSVRRFRGSPGVTLVVDQDGISCGRGRWRRRRVRWEEADTFAVTEVGKRSLRLTAYHRPESRSAIIIDPKKRFRYFPASNSSEICLLENTDVKPYQILAAIRRFTS